MSSSRTTRNEDPEFIERLAAALEQLESGRLPNLAAICEDRPDLIPGIEE